MSQMFPSPGLLSAAQQPAQQGSGMVPINANMTPPPPPPPKKNFFERVVERLQEPEFQQSLMRSLATVPTTLRPNAVNNQAVFQSGIDRRRLQQAQNKTIEYLKQQGRPDLAAMVEADPSLARDVLISSAGIGQDRFRLVTGAQLGLTGPQRNESFSENIMTGEVRPLRSSGITINQGGALPAGYRPTFDEQGNQTGVEPIPGGPEDPNADQEENETKYAAYQAGLKGLMESFDLAQTGNLLGFLPAFTPGDVAFEGVRDAMLQPLKSIFRGKGEGTFTDADAEQLLRMLPTKRDNAETAKMKLFTTENIIRARLGMPLLKMEATKSIVDEARELVGNGRQSAGSN